MDDVQLRIQGSDPGRDIIDRHIVLNDIVYPRLNVSVYCLRHDIGQFVYMDKAPVLVTAAIDRDLTQEIGLEEEAVDHRINPVGWIVSIYIAGPQDDHLPVPGQHVELPFAIPF